MGQSESVLKPRNDPLENFEKLIEIDNSYNVNALSEVQKKPVLKKIATEQIKNNQDEDDEKEVKFKDSQEALEEIGMLIGSDQRWIAPLTTLLDDPNSNIQSLAAWGVANIASKTSREGMTFGSCVLQKLFKVLQTSDLKAKTNAAFAIASLCNSIVSENETNSITYGTQQLLGLLDSNDNLATESAIKALKSLYRSGNNEDVHKAVSIKLVHLLNKSNPAIVNATADYLGDLGRYGSSQDFIKRSGIISTLMNVFNSKFYECYLESLRTLAKLSEQNFLSFSVKDSIVFLKNLIVVIKKDKAKVDLCPDFALLIAGLSKNENVRSYFYDIGVFHQLISCIPTGSEQLACSACIAIGRIVKNSALNTQQFSELGIAKKVRKLFSTESMRVKMAATYVVSSFEFPTSDSNLLEKTMQSCLELRDSLAKWEIPNDLVQLIIFYSEDVQKLSMILSALANFCSYRSIKDNFLGNDALKSMIIMLPKYSPEIKTTCLSILCSLTSSCNLISVVDGSCRIKEGDAVVMPIQESKSIAICTKLVDECLFGNLCEQISSDIGNEGYLYLINALQTLLDIECCSGFVVHNHFDEVLTKKFSDNLLLFSTPSISIASIKLLSKCLQLNRDPVINSFAANGGILSIINLIENFSTEIDLVVLILKLFVDVMEEDIIKEAIVTGRKETDLLNILDKIFTESVDDLTTQLVYKVLTSLLKNLEYRSLFSSTNHFFENICSDIFRLEIQDKMQTTTEGLIAVSYATIDTSIQSKIIEEKKVMCLMKFCTHSFESIRHNAVCILINLAKLKDVILEIQQSVEIWNWVQCCLQDFCNNEKREYNSVLLHDCLSLIGTFGCNIQIQTVLLDKELIKDLLCVFNLSLLDLTLSKKVMVTISRILEFSENIRSQLVCSHQALEIILSYLNHKDEDLIFSSLSIVYYLSRDESFKRKFHEKEGLSSLLNSIKSANVKVKMLSCRVIAILSESCEFNKEIFYKLDINHILIDISCHSVDPTIQIEALKTIGTLTKGENESAKKNRLEITECNDIYKLVDLILNPLPKIQSEICYVLGNVAQNNSKCQVKIVDCKNIVSKLIELSSNTMDENVQLYSCRILSILSTAKPRKAFITKEMDKKSMKDIVFAITSDSECVRSYAITTVLNLASNESCCVQLAHSGVIPALIACLQRSFNVKLLENGCYALSKLGFRSNYVFKSSAGQNFTCQLINWTHHDELGLQKASITTIASLIKHNFENKRALVSCDNFSELFGLIHSSNGRVLENIMSTLSSLSSRSEFIQIVGKFLDITAVIQLLSSINFKIRISSIQVISHLTKESSCKLRFGSDNCIHYIARCVEDEHFQVTEFSIAALANLSFHPGNIERIMETNIFESILLLMSKIISDNSLCNKRSSEDQLDVDSDCDDPINEGEREEIGINGAISSDKAIDNVSKEPLCMQRILQNCILLLANCASALAEKENKLVTSTGILLCCQLVHHPNEFVKKCSCFVLANWCHKSKENIEIATNSGCLFSLIQLLHSTNPSVLGASLWALSKLAQFQDNGLILFNSHIFPMLERVCHSFLDDNVVLSRAFRLLGTIAGDSRILFEINGAQFIKDTVLPILDLKSSQEMEIGEFAKNATRLTYALLKNPNTRNSFPCKMIPILKSVFFYSVNSIDKKKIATNLIGVFHELSGIKEHLVLIGTNDDGIFIRKLISFLTLLLDEDGSHSRILQNNDLLYCVNILSRLVVIEEVKIELCKANVVAVIIAMYYRIVDSLGKPSDEQMSTTASLLHTRILLQISKILQALSSMPENIKESIVSAGGIQMLLDFTQISYNGILKDNCSILKELMASAILTFSSLTLDGSAKVVFSGSKGTILLLTLLSSIIYENFYPILLNEEGLIDSIQNSNVEVGPDIVKSLFFPLVQPLVHSLSNLSFEENNRSLILDYWISFSKHDSSINKESTVNGIQLLLKVLLWPSSNNFVIECAAITLGNLSTMARSIALFDKDQGFRHVLELLSHNSLSSLRVVKYAVWTLSNIANASENSSKFISDKNETMTVLLQLISSTYSSFELEKASCSEYSQDMLHSIAIIDCVLSTLCRLVEEEDSFVLSFFNCGGVDILLRLAFDFLLSEDQICHKVFSVFEILLRNFMLLRFKIDDGKFIQKCLEVCKGDVHCSTLELVLKCVVHRASSSYICHEILIAENAIPVVVNFLSYQDSDIIKLSLQLLLLLTDGESIGNNSTSIVDTDTSVTQKRNTLCQLGKLNVLLSLGILLDSSDEAIRHRSISLILIILLESSECDDIKPEDIKQSTCSLVEAICDYIEVFEDTNELVLTEALKIVLILTESSSDLLLDIPMQSFHPNIIGFLCGMLIETKNDLMTISINILKNISTNTMIREEYTRKLIEFGGPSMLLQIFISTRTSAHLHSTLCLLNKFISTSKNVMCMCSQNERVVEKSLDIVKQFNTMEFNDFSVIFELSELILNILSNPEMENSQLRKTLESKEGVMTLSAFLQQIPIYFEKVKKMFHVFLALCKIILILIDGNTDLQDLFAKMKVCETLGKVVLNSSISSDLSSVILRTLSILAIDSMNKEIAYSEVPVPELTARLHFKLNEQNPSFQLDCLIFLHQLVHGSSQIQEDLVVRGSILPQLLPFLCSSEEMKVDIAVKMLLKLSELESVLYLFCERDSSGIKNLLFLLKQRELKDEISENVALILLNLSKTNENNVAIVVENGVELLIQLLKSKIDLLSAIDNSQKASYHCSIIGKIVSNISYEKSAHNMMLDEGCVPLLLGLFSNTISIQSEHRIAALEAINNLTSNSNCVQKMDGEAIHGAAMSVEIDDTNFAHILSILTNISHVESLKPFLVENGTLQYFIHCFLNKQYCGRTKQNAVCGMMLLAFNNLSAISIIVEANGLLSALIADFFDKNECGEITDEAVYISSIFRSLFRYPDKLELVSKEISLSDFMSVCIKHLNTLVSQNFILCNSSNMFVDNILKILLQLVKPRSLISIDGMDNGNDNALQVEAFSDDLLQALLNTICKVLEIDYPNIQIRSLRICLSLSDSYSLSSVWFLSSQNLLNGIMKFLVHSKYPSKQELLALQVCRSLSNNMSSCAELSTISHYVDSIEIIMRKFCTLLHAQIKSKAASQNVVSIKEVLGICKVLLFFVKYAKVELKEDDIHCLVGLYFFIQSNLEILVKDLGILCHDFVISIIDVLIYFSKVSLKNLECLIRIFDKTDAFSLLHKIVIEANVEPKYLLEIRKNSSQNSEFQQLGSTIYLFGSCLSKTMLSKVNLHYNWFRLFKNIIAIFDDELEILDAGSSNHLWVGSCLCLTFFSQNVDFHACQIVDDDKYDLFMVVVQLFTKSIEVDVVRSSLAALLELRSVWGDALLLKYFDKADNLIATVKKAESCIFPSDGSLKCGGVLLKHGINKQHALRFMCFLASSGNFLDIFRQIDLEKTIEESLRLEEHVSEKAIMLTILKLIQHNKDPKESIQTHLDGLKNSSLNIGVFSEAIGINEYAKKVAERIDSINTLQVLIELHVTSLFEEDLDQIISFLVLEFDSAMMNNSSHVLLQRILIEYLKCFSIIFKKVTEQQLVHLLCSIDNMLFKSILQIGLTNRTGLTNKDEDMVLITLKSIAVDIFAYIMDFEISGKLGKNIMYDVVESLNAVEKVLEMVVSPTSISDVECNETQIQNVLVLQEKLLLFLSILCKKKGFVSKKLSHSSRFWQMLAKQLTSVLFLEIIDDEFFKGIYYSRNRYLIGILLSLCHESPVVNELECAIPDLLDILLINEFSQNEELLNCFSSFFEAIVSRKYSEEATGNEIVANYRALGINNILNVAKLTDEVFESGNRLRMLTCWNLLVFCSNIRAVVPALTELHAISVFIENIFSRNLAIKSKSINCLANIVNFYPEAVYRIIQASKKNVIVQLLQCTRLIHRMKKEEDSTVEVTISSSALQILATLSSNIELKSILSQTECVSILLESLMIENTKIRESSLQILVEISLETIAKDNLIDKCAGVVLTRFINEKSSSISIISTAHALHLLARLCYKSESVCQQMFQEGVLSVVLENLVNFASLSNTSNMSQRNNTNKFISKNSLQIDSVKIICQLAKFSKIAAQMEEIGILKFLAEMLCTTSEELNEKCMRSIVHFLEHVIVTDNLGNEVTIACISSCIKFLRTTTTTSQSVLKNSCIILSSFASNRTGKRIIVEKNGIQSILLHITSNHQKIQLHSLDAIISCLKDFEGEDSVINFAFGKANAETDYILVLGGILLESKKNKQISIKVLEIFELLFTERKLHDFQAHLTPVILEALFNHLTCELNDEFDRILTVLAVNILKNVTKFLKNIEPSSYVEKSIKSCIALIDSFRDTQKEAVLTLIVNMSSFKKVGFLILESGGVGKLLHAIKKGENCDEAIAEILLPTIADLTACKSNVFPSDDDVCHLISLLSTKNIKAQSYLIEILRNIVLNGGDYKDVLKANNIDTLLGPVLKEIENNSSRTQADETMKTAIVQILKEIS